MNQAMTPPADTHEVLNQSPVYAGHNAWNGDPLLRRVCHALGDGIKKDLASHGAWAGAAESFDLARLANRNLPVLRTHDAKGHRLDVVEFHPAYHALMRKSASIGLHCSIWDDAPAERGVRNSGARGALLPVLAARDRASLPDHHDQRRRRGDDGHALDRQRMAAAHPVAQI